MMNLIKQILTISSATDEGCDPKWALSKGKSSGKQETLPKNVYHIYQFPLLSETLWVFSLYIYIYILYKLYIPYISHIYYI